MKAHDLAAQLLECENYEIGASIDISTCEDDAGRRIQPGEFLGINDAAGHGNEITLLFWSEPVDNNGKRF